MSQSLQRRALLQALGAATVAAPLQAAQGAPTYGPIPPTDNLGAVRALSDTLPNTILIGGRDGGIFSLDPADTTSEEDGGLYCGTIIRPANYSTAGIYKRETNGSLDACAFGVSPEMPDNLPMLHAARDAAIRLGVTLTITATAPIKISDHFTLKDNLAIEWLSNRAYFTLTQPSTSGAVITTIDAVHGDINVSSVEIINPCVDASNIPGQNGIGLGGAGGTRDINITGGHIKNCRRSPNGKIVGGGRAVTFQLGLANCSALDFVAENCTTGGDIHGWKDVPNSEATALRLRYHAENCEEGFTAFDLQKTGSNDPDFINCDVEFTAHNCGLSVIGSKTGDSGGAIILERSSFAQIRATIINDSDYGLIGAVVRGKGYHNNVRATFVGDAVALVYASNAVSLAPVTPNVKTPFNDNILIVDHVRGTCENVIRGDTAAKFQRNHVKAIIATVSGNIILEPVDDSTNSTLEILRRVDGFRVVAANTDYKAFFPTVGTLYRFGFGNGFKTGNLTINISGGMTCINNDIDEDWILARNGSTKLRLTTNGLRGFLPTFATDAEAGKAGLVTNDLYYETTTRTVKGKA